MGRWQPKTAQRGYGAIHKALRKRWAPIVARGDAYCARCEGWIAPDGQRCPRCRKLDCGWDLGHDDADRSKYAGPEHACCNRATRAHAAKRRALSRPAPTPRPRADWW